MNYELAAAPVVLLIDDDPAICTLFRIQLSASGYRVLVAESGAEALRLIGARSDIQLVIMDVVMPGLSGPELAARIDETLPGVEILFCSGYEPEDLARFGIDSTGDRFLPKPYRAAELKAKVERLLERASVSS